MKSKGPDSSARRYRMTARAEAAEQTARAILEACVELWHETSPDAITLTAIAERAGVSVQTVLRRFGSKEGVFEACIDGDAGGVSAERDRVATGDVEGALAVLLAHYERDGDATLRTLALTERMPAASKVAENGRRVHRAWCERVFAPWLPGDDEDARGERVDAFVAATDLYLWQLLRRDLGRTRAATARTFRRLVDGLTTPRDE